MSNLEAELARFEAELAAVETSHQQETGPQQDTGHHQDHAAPVTHYSSNAAQVSAPANAPPVHHVPIPQPAQHHQTGPMYHEYNPPAQAAAPPMMGDWMAYGGQQAAYDAQANAYYMQPGMEGYMSAPAPTMTGATLSAAPVFTAPDEMEPAQDDGSIPKEEGFKGKDYKGKPGQKVKRFAAGQTWWDPTLAEWPENDFRIFVGDLGNEVNDDVLTKAFQKYPSFAKAKVVRDKRSNKSKGFGFVSFLESGDYAKALREMDGKYIGNRPCKLRKSSWQERNALPKGKHYKKQKTG